MTLFRFRYVVLGGHTHVRVFAGESVGLSGALTKCGDLTFRNEEWEQFVMQLKDVYTNILFIPDQT